MEEHENFQKIQITIFLFRFQIAFSNFKFLKIVDLSLRIAAADKCWVQYENNNESL